ncbi:MAG: NADH-quinone oxidoreductase subunit K [Candidatus Omnitrophica bacterium]|nr:NADH-quinone oxidoreductase subunit K [Candidatus Omnitrophota bacterium]
MIIASFIGLLYIAGFYLLLRRSLVRAAIGALLLGHAANLLIFVSGGLSAGAPIIREGEDSLISPYPDPLPQALVLTAIVIGLGVSAYLLALIHRTAEIAGGDDMDDLKEEE